MKTNILLALFQLVLAVVLAALSTALVISQWYLAGAFTWYIGVFVLMALLTYVMVRVAWKEYCKMLKQTEL